jgi:hypothetical protein
VLWEIIFILELQFAETQAVRADPADVNAGFVWGYFLRLLQKDAKIKKDSERERNVSGV